MEAVHDGETGVERILAGGYAIVVLDVMLPGIGGLEVLRRVRKPIAGARDHVDGPARDRRPRARTGNRRG